MTTTGRHSVYICDLLESADKHCEYFSFVRTSVKHLNLHTDNNSHCEDLNYTVSS